MTTYMPPMQTKARAEKAPPHGLNSTNRVFGNYDEKNTRGMYNGSHYARTFKGEKHPSQPQPRLSSATRHNKPHPEGVGFLIQDCATLHDPICDVKTKVNPNDAHWWPSRENPNTNKNPVYTKDTISRSDYKTYKNRPQGQTRHGSNPNTMPAHGPVPVTQLANPTGPRLLMERISYQHGYDSRKTNNLQQRGKLHGNFVWDVFHPTSQPDTKDVPSRPRLPGRGSEGMRNIMMHDLTHEPNRAVREAQFPSQYRPLKPIAGKVGGKQEGKIVPTDVPSAGLRHDTVPALPPIGM
ncbi:uncharacterized protein C2orf73 homolog [Lytechinus pictus]|uniref:uncharacterized protein C2orf73 homolog n=1 Tax=Lytechinus pictus TaxID=7653 RepID=UPI0030B9ADD2